MSEKHVYECDQCGYQRSTYNQLWMVYVGGSEFDNDLPLHFCNIYCLNSWTHKHIKEIDDEK